MESYEVSLELLKKLGFVKSGTPPHFIRPKHWLHPYQYYKLLVLNQRRGKFWKQSI